MAPRRALPPHQATSPRRAGCLRAQRKGLPHTREKTRFNAPRWTGRAGRGAVRWGGPRPAGPRELALPPPNPPARASGAPLPVLPAGAAGARCGVAARAVHDIASKKKATKHALSLMAMPSECISISIIMAAVANRSFPPASLSEARERFRFFFGGRARRRLGGAIAVRRARSAARANETGARGTADVHFAALFVAGKNATAPRGERTALARGGGGRGGGGAGCEVRGRHSSASERPLASYLPRIDPVFARPYGQGRRRARNADEANEGHHSLLTSGGMGCVCASELARGVLAPACAAAVRLARDARRATADRRLFLCCAARVCA